MSAIPKYLRQWAELETQRLTSFPEAYWDYCLTIPAYQEDEGFLDRLKAGLLKENACLLILVINQPDSVSEPDPINQRLLSAANRNPAIWREQHLSLHRVFETKSHILVIDRFIHRAIPKKNGVGLARKIAGDLALFLMASGRVKKPWIYCTDADTFLPPDYFQSVPEECSTAAVVFPFRHRCHNNDLGRATQLYELSLHYYVKGLQQAGSPYAFHTIGSTLAISGEHYAQVRGFPKKSGGEDFYLLNKLAKTGTVKSLTTPLVEIEARLSFRVPFGTGPAVNKILRQENPGKELYVYNPQIFDALKDWLKMIPRLWQHPETIDSLPLPTLGALTELGVEAAIRHSLSHSKNKAAFCKQMHIWFDGFLTLKFVHLLRDKFPNVPLAECDLFTTETKNSISG